VGGTGPLDSGLPGPDAGLPDAGAADSGQPDAGQRDGGAADSGAPDAGPVDSGVPDAGDFCAGAKLCERFDEYDAGTLSDGTMFGPWRVNVQDSSGGAVLDDVQGSRALHVHIDQGASSGAQIKTRAAPLFASTRQQLYGRFKMYLGNDGSSIHWTMWGASGIVPQGTTTAGASATYLFSSFADNNNKNDFSEVYGNSQTGQDCYHGSQQLMPVGRWACVAWSLDAPNRQYRMWLDGTSVPSMSLNDMGDGCVNQANQSWWGPDFDELYLGALSFHPMSAPLDLWFDDIVVDTSPVSCP
jgi:hypothetical protein